jgi:hypothetical protein
VSLTVQLSDPTQWWIRIPSTSFDDSTHDQEDYQ